ncbi:MAG: PAS domain S-box, partial [Gammaproteobacteria bacterium]|nr:PAS domain S-box [Gammaproteobacteria bacterium]
MRTHLDILLVEDLADDRDLISHLLKKRMDNVRITCEDKRSEVIKLLNNKTFDLLIVDYFLKGYTGLELIDEIRGLKGFDIPIIMVTGDETEGVALQSIQHGVDDFVIKTLKGIKELPDIIHRAIKRADIHKIKFTSENRIIDTGEIFQNLYENASELIFTIWPDGTFVNVNEATLNTLGIVRRDVGIKNFVEFIDSTCRGQFKSALNKLFSNQNSADIELVLRSSDNKTINVTGHGHPHQVNGKVVATNWIFRNVTSEKYMESLLWDDYNQYSGIFDYIPVAVMLSDRRGVILQANTQACSLLGYATSELQGLHIENITHPDDIQLSLEHHKKLMTGQLEKYTIEKRYKRKNGDYIWTEISGSLVKNSKGDPLYGIAHIKDISELKHFEELLGKLAQDLISVKGDYIFDRLSARLIELLHSDYVFIAYIRQDAARQKVSTLLFRDKVKNNPESGFSFPEELLQELIAEDELVVSNQY